MLWRDPLDELGAGDRAAAAPAEDGAGDVGHVDAVGKIVSIKPEGDSKLYTFEVPANEARYLIEKGSVALDGISLTVFGIRGRRFSVALIPHTLKVTTLGYKKPGDRVNVESDLLAKYIERVVGGRAQQANLQ